MASSSNSSFSDFLKLIGERIQPSQLHEMKKALTGHVNREDINRMTSGHIFLSILVKNKLLSEKKLAFLQSVLQSTRGGKSDVRELLSLVDNFRKVSQVSSNTEEISPKEIVRDLKSLEEVNERNTASLQESTTAMERITLKLSTLNEDVTMQKALIREFTEELQTMNENQEVLMEKCKQIESEVDNKCQAITMQRNHLKSLEEQLELNQNKLKELETRLATKGEGRINTFKRPFAKDKVAVIQQLIYDIEKKILDQQRLLMNLDEELVSIHSPLEPCRGDFRTISKNVKDGKTKLILMYKSLHITLHELLEMTDEQLYCEQYITELKQNMDSAIKEISRDQINEEHEFSVNKLQTVEGRRALVEASSNNKGMEFDFKLLGRDIYTITHRAACCTEIVDETLQQLVCININKDGDIIVANAGKKNHITCLSIFGETRFRVDLDALKPVDMTIDTSNNNYIVAGCRLIRVYEHTRLKVQFLPYYVANKMLLPNIVSLDYSVSDDQLFLLDKQNKVVQLFKTTGQYVCKNDISETTKSPSKLCILVHTSVKCFAVTDSKRHCVNIYHTQYDQSLKCVSYGMYGIGLCEFAGPTGISCDGRGNMAICDSGNHRVCILDCHGDHIACYGRLGRSKRCLNSPCDVVIHSTGRMVIIADKNNSRLVVYL